MSSESFNPLPKDLEDLEADARETSAPSQAARSSKKCACTLTATAESFGLLVRGVGIVSVQKVQTGGYFLTFDRDVSDGVYVATIGTPGNIFLMPPGEITVSGIENYPYSIGVQTYNSAGQPADRGFHVAVHLPG